jgi:hypothetical protein
MNTTDVRPIIPDADWHFYEEQADSLFKAYKSFDNNVIQHVRKYHPNAEKSANIIVPVSDFTIQDAGLIVAREHGFEDIAQFRYHIAELANPDSAVSLFERAADAVVEGERDHLTEMISEHPELAKMRSSRYHEATLLHYVSANGVENFRQKTPDNIVEIADILLSEGIAADSFAKCYGSKWGTTLELTVSSAHLAKAARQSALIEKLLDFGAAVNGIHDNSSPLLTALCFRNMEAARTLERRGARVDNLVAAASLGKLDLVARYFDEGGKIRTDLPLLGVDWLKLEADHHAHLQHAFVWAAMHNQQEVVSFLLDKGVSAGSRDNRLWTALHWAAFLGNPEMVELLLAHKAPLEARNEFGGTVLDQTLWATVHDGVGPHHVDIIKRLIGAGAKIHSWWLFAGLTPPLDERIVQILEAYEM